MLIITLIQKNVCAYKVANKVDKNQQQDKSDIYYFLLVLVERLIFKDNDLCVTTGLSINGQLFVTPKEHLDALVSIKFTTL